MSARRPPPAQGQRRAPPCPQAPGSCVGGRERGAGPLGSPAPAPPRAPRRSPRAGPAPRAHRGALGRARRTWARRPQRPPGGEGRGGAVRGAGAARGRAGRVRVAGRSRSSGPRLWEAGTCSEVRAPRSAGHEVPVAGAVRAGAAVARGPGRLRRGGALLPRPGPRLLRPRLEARPGLRDLLLRPSLPPHRGLLLRLRQGVPSSPVHRGGVEPLERLLGPVQAGGPRAAAPGAAGSPERRRALPGPGGASRLPGVLDAAGPGLRPRLRPCLHNYLCIQQGENKTSCLPAVAYRHTGCRVLHGVQDRVTDSPLRQGKPPSDAMDAVPARGVHSVCGLSASSHELCKPALFRRRPGLRRKSDSPLASNWQPSMSRNLEKSSASRPMFLSSCAQFYIYIDREVNISKSVCKQAKYYQVMFNAS